MRDDIDLKLNRLLRSAAGGGDDNVKSAPFGFDTRVIALWRAGTNNNGHDVVELIRRVAFLATAVIVIASAAAFRELKQSRETGESLTNEFAIADSEIQSELSE